MSNGLNALAWLCQLLAAYFFMRSAYRKVTGFARVSEEFERWGYPWPGQVTFFLIVVWILCASALLVPALAGFAALLLLLFMVVAFVTLLIHGEYRRLVEPTQPIVLLLIIILIRGSDMLDILS